MISIRWFSTLFGYHVKITTSELSKPFFTLYFAKSMLLEAFDVIRQPFPSNENKKINAVHKSYIEGTKFDIFKNSNK